MCVAGRCTDATASCAAIQALDTLQKNGTATPSLFPRGSGSEAGVKTAALPAIWEKWTEFQAAAKLSEAAEVLARFPIAIQLRFLQTMREIASERSTTTFFPIPLDILGPLLGRSRDDGK